MENYPILELLGVSIDGQMNFKDHVGEVTKKASKQVGVLLRLRNIIPQSAKLKIYKTAILPLLTYCHIVWHFCAASDARKLERVQEKALRAVYRSKTATYDTLLKMVNLPTLCNRRLQDVAILMYKVKQHLCPKYISDLFNLKSSGYALRNADFIVPRFNTVNFGKHTIRYLGPVPWSKLSMDVRRSDTLQVFKNRIRRIDLNNLINEHCTCMLCDS